MQTLPPGFAMALSQSRAAMVRYSQLPPSHRSVVLEQVSQAKTKGDMQSVVYRLAHWPAAETLANPARPCHTEREKPQGERI